MCGGHGPIAEDTSMSEWKPLLSPPHFTAAVASPGSGALAAAPLHKLKARAVDGGVGGGEKAGNDGVQAVTVNINGDSSCGINAAHLGGRRRGGDGGMEREG